MSERIGIFERQALNREALQFTLSARGHDVVLSTGVGAELLEKLPRCGPLVLLFALCVAATPAFAAFDEAADDSRRLISAARTVHPQARVVVLGPAASFGSGEQWRQLGAHGFVAVDEIGTVGLVETIQRVAADNSAPAFTPKFDEEHEREMSLVGSLSPREREVLGHLAIGSDNLKIASMLGITERTVRAHTHNLYAKLACENRLELALMARRWGVAASAEREG